ncbi:hypothetical protein AB4212_43080, partial [Streptomyces sp. 2MCAF27]
YWPGGSADSAGRSAGHRPGRPTPTEVLEQLSQNDSPTEDWLPPPVRTTVDLHNAPTGTAP